MNRFQKLLSDNSNTTLQRRANSVAETARIAQQNLVNQIKQEKSRLELKLADLTDFSPETTDSLRPASKDWSAEEWVREMQATKEELYQVTLSLKLAEETYNEYFAEENEV